LQGPVQLGGSTFRRLFQAAEFIARFGRRRRLCLDVVSRRGKIRLEAFGAVALLLQGISQRFCVGSRTLLGVRCGFGGRLIDLLASGPYSGKFGSHRAKFACKGARLFPFLIKRLPLLDFYVSRPEGFRLEFTRKLLCYLPRVLKLVALRGAYRFSYRRHPIGSSTGRLFGPFGSHRLHRNQPLSRSQPGTVLSLFGRHNENLAARIAFIRDRFNGKA